MMCHDRDGPRGFLTLRLKSMGILAGSTIRRIGLTNLRSQPFLPISLFTFSARKTDGDPENQA